LARRRRCRAVDAGDHLAGSVAAEVAIDAISIIGSALRRACVRMDGTSKASIEAVSILDDRVGDGDVGDDRAFQAAIDDARHVPTCIRRTPSEIDVVGGARDGKKRKQPATPERHRFLLRAYILALLIRAAFRGLAAS
jgi:hypothetical protein